MAKNPSVKKTRRIKVFTPNLKFCPRSSLHLAIAVEAGKNYLLTGKSSIEGHHWIIIEDKSIKYDVLLSDTESKLGVFRTIEVPHKK